MSAAIHEILKQVRSLTPEDRARLLEELQALNAEQVFGKYASVPSSSEAFCSRKRSEIDLEDRPSELRP
jgi:hypothetical protein